MTAPSSDVILAVGGGSTPFHWSDHRRHEGSFSPGFKLRSPDGHPADTADLAANGSSRIAVSPRVRPHRKAPLGSPCISCPNPRKAVTRVPFGPLLLRWLACRLLVALLDIPLMDTPFEPHSCGRGTSSGHRYRAYRRSKSAEFATSSGSDADCVRFHRRNRRRIRYKSEHTDVSGGGRRFKHSSPGSRRS